MSWLDKAWLQGTITIAAPGTVVHPGATATSASSAIPNVAGCASGASWIDSLSAVPGAPTSADLRDQCRNLSASLSVEELPLEGGRFLVGRAVQSGRNHQVTLGPLEEDDDREAKLVTLLTALLASLNARKTAANEAIAALGGPVGPALLGDEHFPKP